jgi:hypothetical protein
LVQTPFIARTDPIHGFITHDGAAMTPIEHVWITGEGRLILGSGERIAMIDDRDLAECLPLLRVEGEPVDDTFLLEWLSNSKSTLQFLCGESLLPVHALYDENLGTALGFNPKPVTAK